MTFNKKAQAFTISDLGTVAIALVVAAIILGLGATILDAINDTQTENVAAFGNESVTFTVNGTQINLAVGTIDEGTIVLFFNGTTVNQGVAPEVNYTTTVGSITIFNISDYNIGTDQDTYNVSYSFTFGSEAINNTNFGLTGIVTLSSFIPTIAIVAAAAIVIGIILVFFGRRED